MQGALCTLGRGIKTYKWQEWHKQPVQSGTEDALGLRASPKLVGRLFHRGMVLGKRSICGSWYQNPAQAHKYVAGPDWIDWKFL